MTPGADMGSRRVNSKGLWCWFAVLPAVGMAWGEERIEAREIAENVWFVNHFFAVRNISYGSRRNPFHVANLPPRGKVKRYTLERHLNNDYDEGDVRARDLVIFRSGKLRGTGILVDIPKDAKRPMSFAIWLPALRKVRRHAEPDQADAWGGSLFTYGDIYLRRPEDEYHELLGTERFDGCLGLPGKPLQGLPEPSCEAEGRPVWRLRSTTRFANWWYDYREVLVDKRTYADYRSIYFKNGEPIKIIDKDWRSMGLADPRGQYWLYWYGRDLRSGLEGVAWVTREQVVWNREVDPGLWSLGTLRRLSR